MIKLIKCENCGANMNTDTENNMLFCPYCGFALRKPETSADLIRFAMKHDEEVRQKKVSEENKTTRQALVICGGVLAAIVILILLFVYLPRNDEESRLKETVSKVQQLIISGDYETALVEAQAIRVEKSGLFDERYNRWENQRKDLIKLIEQKKRESN